MARWCGLGVWVVFGLGAVVRAKRRRQGLAGGVGKDWGALMTRTGVDGMGEARGKARAFRLTAEVQPERELHRAVVRLLGVILEPSVCWCCYPAGQLQLTVGQTGRLAAAGLKRGFPDLLLWHGGRSYGIELKREGARLSRGYLDRTARGGAIWRAGQEEVFEALRAAGMAIGICRSVDEVVERLRVWGLPMRRANVL